MPFSKAFQQRTSGSGRVVRQHHISLDHTVVQADGGGRHLRGVVMGVRAHTQPPPTIGSQRGAPRPNAHLAKTAPMRRLMLLTSQGEARRTSVGWPTRTTRSRSPRAAACRNR